MSTFNELYARRLRLGRFICVGLDPDISQIPDCVTGDTVAERVYNFLVSIVDATHGYALAYKPQIAYFEDEALEGEGHKVLRRIIAYIRSVDPTIPVIVDFKRGDIGRTNEPYVRLGFDFFGADAVTVHPYLGMEAMKPFLARPDKTVIVLCRTSNPGAGEFQDVECTAFYSKEDGAPYSTLKEAARELGVDTVDPEDYERITTPLYEFVARRVLYKWNKAGNCAIVVGATYPAELGDIRRIIGDEMLILVPGLGTQGGDLEKTLQYGRDSKGWGIIPNNSSALLFAYAKLRDDESGELKYTPEQFSIATTEATNAMYEAIVAAMVEQDLRRLDGIMSGRHFVYKSWKHGDAYVNYDPAFPHLQLVRSHCVQLVTPFLGEFDTIVAPATGGIVLGTLCGEIANEQGHDVLVTWADKHGDDFVLERDGAIQAVQGKRVLVVDDTMTNANERGSVYKLCRLIEAHGGTVVGVSLICNRCNGTAEQLQVPLLKALMSFDFVSYEADQCPHCLQNLPIVEDIGHGAEFKQENPDYAGGYTKLL